MKLVVYLLTNLINGKIYVGKTKRNLSQRLADHKYFANKGHKSPISRAIAKYGWENFSIQVLETCKEESELNKQEYYWINKKQCTDPKIGYNIINEIQDHRVVDSERIREEIRQASQGRKSYNSKYSQYLGVRLWAKKWYCQVAIDRENVSRVCPSETAAAELYDKLVLYHFGPDAGLNFPENRPDYLSQDLHKVFEEFTRKPKTSKYEGICWDKSRNQWIATYIKDKKKLLYKRFKFEEDAYNYRKDFLNKL